MVPILEGVSGVLKPGRLTLLLGHPGAGKTVLLNALAGQLRGDPTLEAREGRGGQSRGDGTCPCCSSRARCCLARTRRCAHPGPPCPLPPPPLVPHCRTQVTADELSYNGRSLLAGPGGRPLGFVPERAAAVIPPLDSHFGELTVRQTLEFAARVQGSLFAGGQKGCRCG